MSVYRNQSRRTTDKWETVHVHSSTGKWDYGREVIKDSGFDAVILAEDIWQLNGGQKYPSTFGYFDDGSRSSPYTLGVILICREFGLFLEICRQRNETKTQEPVICLVENNHVPHATDLPAEMERREYEVLFR